MRIGSEPRGARVERIEMAPSAPQPVFAVAGVGGSMPAPRAPNPSSQTFPRFVPETGALQPSTLQAQAAQLEAGNEPPAPRSLAALAPEKPSAAVARSRGPFEIQIGAFGDSAEAERRMAAARERAGGLLDPYRGFAIPVQSGDSKLYRARFRGFDATAANDTCSRLRSLKIDCFVIKTQ